MKRKEFSLGLVIFLCASFTANASLWNQLVSFEGQLQMDDFTSDASSARASKYFLQPFRLNLLSDQTFEFELESTEKSSRASVEGEAQIVQEFSLNSNTYELKTTASSIRIKGQISYETGWGVTWSYSLKIQQLGLIIERSQNRYAYLNIIFILIFGASGIIIFSISDRARVMILYNLRKRTHPVALMIITLKVSWVLGCFIILGYETVRVISIWVIFFLYGVYLFSLSPSIIHILYFISAAQKGLTQIQLYKQRTVIQKFIIVISLLLIAIATYFTSFAFNKGIIFFYILSLNTAFMYIYSCKIKKFAFGRLIIYDAILTFILSLLSLYLPVGKFTVASYKQMVLFWNYFLFIFAFGMIFMKKFIKNEIVQEIQLSQFSTRQAGTHPTDSERRESHKSPQSCQIIDQ